MDDPSHLLVCCGDCFDRGDENYEVLRFFERIENKVVLRGNHEDMLLKLFDGGRVLPHHYMNGTMRTLENFFGKYFMDPVTGMLDLESSNRTVDRICDFIAQTLDYYETENYVFVHGWLPPCEDSPEARRAVSSQSWERARWVKWTECYTGEAPLGGKTLVCGHMPTFYAGKYDGRSDDCADIFYGEGMIALDAGTYDSRQINVLVIEDELTY